jgi:Kinesin motor domain
MHRIRPTSKPVIIDQEIMGICIILNCSTSLSRNLVWCCGLTLFNYLVFVFNLNCNTDILLNSDSQLVRHPSAPLVYFWNFQSKAIQMLCKVSSCLPLTIKCTLEIRMCTDNGQMSLPEAKMLPVGSTEDVINVMKLGERNRASSSTAMNDRSSRSHR